MATKVLTSSDTVSRTTISDHSTPSKLQSKIVELRRLSTFGSMTNDIHSTLTKGLLAKIGFFYMGKENTIKCDDCGFEIESSTSQNNLIEKHRNYNPKCQFILTNSEVYSANNLPESTPTSNISQTDKTISNSQMSMNCVLMDYENESNPQKAFLNFLSNETITKLRANTFSNWPLITPNAEDMISAGWAYTNIGDRVMCIYCNVLYHKWTETDRAYQIHRLKSPQCPFVLAAEKKAILTGASNISITTMPNTQAAVKPMSTTYALPCHRSDTFGNWPHTEKNPLPPIESFVDAGFYYTGEGKIVRCFHCNGALRDWQSTDDPKVEHARWYPNCAYIRQFIGEDLYHAIQRKNRELKAQQNNDTRTPEAAAWSHDDIDRMVKARLDLPIVEKIRQAGFSMAIIRKSFEMQLRFKKDDFKSDNDLLLACLILDQQVKLINGNETNIFVPQDWMKKYFEDQEKGVEQQQCEPQQTQINHTPAPQVITPVVSRPKTMERLDEEALPCVLCLTTERQVACLPCGHLASCVACGHSLKTCPICRATVKAFVRIYV